MLTEKPINIDAYITMFPQETQNILVKIRTIIRELVPESEESISYAMPAFKLKKKAFIYFAGYKNHIGIYATPSGHAEFKTELSKFKQGKGSVQFPLDQPIPFDLITRMIIYKKNNILQTIKR